MFAALASHTASVAACVAPSGGVVLAEAVSLDGGVLFVVLVVLALLAVAGFAVLVGGCWVAYRAGRRSGTARAWLAAIVVCEIALTASLGAVTVAGLVPLGVAYALGVRARHRDPGENDATADDDHPAR